MKKILLYLSIASISINLILASCLYENMNSPNKVEYVYVDKEVMTRDTLNDWQLFTLALMKVESGYNSQVVSSAGASGYFQMTPIYVKEVNRIHGTDFKFEQVTDFKTANQIFNLMQDAHNPDYNIEKAMILHNGDREWYKKKIYNAMKDIARYEEIRSLVINN